MGSLRDRRLLLTLLDEPDEF
ncbi:protein of unknown function [Candidatus Nitrospira inopinata]|uniref:Uncharacterized protein n=1 Tax=Candidatus Nitrospira inopinata TaxID=1715989 RepID=A0A0S4KVJ1_9BACT|nr:protein of unknown function [Candidatus Nitrospira inopinata]